MATEVTDDTFEAEVMKSDTPVLVDFWAPWCGPCKTMLPIMDEITKDYDGKAKVVKINVDENSETAQKYSVMSIPTFLIIKGGKVEQTFVGAKSKEDIAKELDAVIG
ncbi:MAG: thioredoxin [bacterium]|nr:thioredoxin [bacterium]